jgi:D-alanyl-D-alanine carboxypeptidase
MNIRWQTLILILLILSSFSLTKIKIPFANESYFEADKEIKINKASNFSAENQKAQLLPQEKTNLVQKSPVRKWSVLDPKVQAKTVLIQSLNEHFPFFHYNTYQTWPLASLSKLFTAIVVIENAGKNKKIPITERAQNTEGTAGGIKTGEIYTSEDLLKIMLLTSSNDAATAFEDYFGGNEVFLKLINKKIDELGMEQTVLYDGSGLSDLNESSASDMLKLTKYVLEKEPEIFSWTRLNNFIAQPLNGTTSRTINNINPLVNNGEFFGGKTGTSQAAGENLIAIFSLQDYRVAVIILGSPDRLKETENLLNWVKQAYEF